MSHVTRKSVFWVVRPGNPNWPAQLQKVEILEIFSITSTATVLSLQHTIKAMITLRGCVFVVSKWPKQLYHGLAHMILAGFLLG